MSSRDELEDDIIFQDVLIESLDTEADDYEEKLAGFQAAKRDLERQIEALDMPGAPPAGLDGANDPPESSANGLGGSHPSSSFTNDPWPSPSASQVNSNGTKRSRPHSSFLAQHEYPSKRPTPENSSGSTPTSNSSFEFVDRPNNTMSDRARERQMGYEAAMRRRLEEQQADAELARRLSQTPAHGSRPLAGPSSSQRPGVQTTLQHNGSFSRPPPMARPVSPGPAPPPSSQQTKPRYSLPSASSGMPTIKPEPSYPALPSTQQQRPRYSLPSESPMPGMRPIKPEPRPSLQSSTPKNRASGPVVDLTGDDSDELTEIAPKSFTPSKRSAVPPQKTRNLYPQDWQQRAAAPPQYTMPNMPGAFPGLTYNGQQVYGPPNPAGLQPQIPTNGYTIPPRASAPSHFGTRTPNAAMPSAVHAPRGPNTYAHSTPRDTLGGPQEAQWLVNGSSSRPFPLYDYDDDDDDLIYGGSRLAAPPNPYQGHEELFRRRFDQILEHDPQKTKEEINDLLNNIRPDEDVPDELLVPTPEAMAVTLHKYQEAGLTWLKKCEEGTNKGGILADDMGLGKTIQMLSLIVTRKSEDPRCKTTLIVAPVALLRQWQQEIQQKIKPGRHALTVHIHHGAAKKKSFRDLQHYDVVITTYGSLASELKKMEMYQLRKKRDPDARPNQAERCILIDPDACWYRVILDEAQCIKNKSSQTAKGACLVNAKYRFCMTGTPMMNNIGELFSLIHFLRIKPYCEWEKFRFDFVTPLKSANDSYRSKSMKMLQTLCRAIMLRRTKKSKHQGRPILVLPERTTDMEHAEFSNDESEFYKALESKTAIQFNKYLKAGTVGRQYTAILVLLLRLRQAACHPHLIRDFSVSAAAGVAVEDMIKLAEQLEPRVVARIKESEGAFECPICMDACTNPAIFLPCGHDTCRDCFATLCDPANQIAQGNENGVVRCPECRGNIDTKRITDFDSFKKVHMRELLSKAELEEDGGSNDVSDDGDSDSDTESEDEMEDQTLDGFIVNDDAEEEPADSSTESEAEEEDEVKPKKEIKGEGQIKAENDDDDDDVVGPSRRKSKQGVQDSKGRKPKRSKKSKGKAKAKEKKLTLADLKKLATRNAGAKKKYLRRLRKDWISSAKIDKMMDILDEVVEKADDGEKVLIFSQWTSLLDLAEVPIEGKGWGYRRYDGSMNAKMRGDAVDDFKDTRKNVRIMLVSLKAGNAGLNLNIASRVIILDPFWNPYVEEQAIDRAHRIGQKRPVKVHRVLIEATVEDRIIELQEKKRALIEEALDEKEHQNISRLGVQELAYLFGVTRNANETVNYTEARRR